MNSTDSKIVRVELEAADGTISKLTGEEAQKWKEVADGQTVFCFAHGMNFPELKWDVQKGDQNE